MGTRKRSEQIGVTSAAVAVDKTYSLQRFQLSGSAVDYRYQNFSYLSFTALNYSAGWNWSLTPRLRGILSTSRVETPTNFQDFKGLNTRNVHTDLVTRFESELDVAGGWRGLAGLEHAAGLEEQPVVREGDRRVQTASLGARYVFGSGSMLTYRLRDGRGDSTALFGQSAILPASFDSRSHEVEFAWAVSAKTRLNARIGHVDRTYANDTQRNFSGVTSAVNAQWDATAKVSVEGAVQREFIPFLTLGSSYIASDRVYIAPVWNATSRIKVRARYDVASRHYDGAAFGAADASGRRDTYRVTSLSVEWQPVRAATVSLTLQQIRNNSNVPGAAYDSNGANLAARLSF